MDFEGALRARLIAAAPVYTIVAGRVYWDDRPQSSPLPDLTISIPVDERPQHMGGFQGTLGPLVQIDVRSISKATTKALTEAVIAAVSPATTVNGIVFLRAADVRISTLNESSSTTFIHRNVIEMIAWHYPA